MTTMTNQDQADRLKGVLRQRARQLQIYALSTLCLIVVVLAAGSWIFVSAGAFAQSDAQPALDTLEKQLDEFDKQWTGLAKQRAKALERYDVALHSSDDTNQRNPLTDAALREINAIDKATAELNVAYTKLSGHHRSLQDAVAKVHLTSVISAVMTRIGAVILLLFLVQILTPLFRYNVMLAAHYDARADSLSLVSWTASTTDAQLLEQVVRSLSPDTIGFGPPPQSSAERAVEIVGQAFAAKLK